MLGSGVALTAITEKSNTAKTKSITMQSLKFNLKLLYLI